MSDAPPDDDPAAIHEALQQAVLKAPDNDDARFDYVKFLLQGGQTAQGKAAFAPAAAKAPQVRKLDALQRWIAAIDFSAGAGEAQAALAGFDAKVAANRRDFEARFG